jgi:hypothetical protein
VNGSQKSFYFLVCERFPLFAMLKNWCGKISRAKARRSRDNFRAKSHIYYFLRLQKLSMAILGHTPQTRANPCESVDTRTPKNAHKTLTECPHSRVATAQQETVRKLLTVRNDPKYPIDTGSISIHILE